MGNHEFNAIAWFFRTLNVLVSTCVSITPPDMGTEIDTSTRRS